MEEQINYRLILILENIPHSATSYQVRLDGRTLELTDDEPILSIRTEAGVHNIEVSSSPTVRESASFRIHPGQIITKIFVRPTARKIELDIDIGLRARPPQDRESEETETRFVPAPAPSRRGTGAAWLAFMFLFGLVCGLLLSLAIWPARSRAAASPAQTLESPSPSDGPDEGHYTIEVRNVQLTLDTTGAPAVVITYNWTNNSGDTINAAKLFQTKAFQGGVQLDAAEIQDVWLYDPAAYTRELRPDATLELQAVFLLMSERAVIEFEVSPLPGVPGTRVIEEFDPENLTEILPESVQE